MLKVQKNELELFNDLSSSMVAMKTTWENESLATAKLSILQRNVQLQNCSKSNSEQLCNWKYYFKINSFQDTKYHKISIKKLPKIWFWTTL